MLNIVFQKYVMKINIRTDSGQQIKGNVFHVFRYMIKLSSEMITYPCRAFKI